MGQKTHAWRNIVFKYETEDARLAARRQSRKESYYKHKVRINEQKRNLYAQDKNRRLKIISNTSAYAKGHPEVNKRAQRKRKYGITEQEFDTLLVNQNGRCAICGTRLTWETRSTTPCVDHDEETKTVRGILCPKCNIAIGLLNHEPWTIRAAEKYLHHYM